MFYSQTDPLFLLSCFHGNCTNAMQLDPCMSFTFDPQLYKHKPVRLLTVPILSVSAQWTPEPPQNIRGK